MGSNYGSCPACQNSRPLRECSGLCHKCHRRSYYLKTKAESANDAAFDPETSASRQRIREAYFALCAAWASDDPSKEELAAFNLIEAVEDYLGKV